MGVDPEPSSEMLLLILGGDSVVLSVMEMTSRRIAGCPVIDMIVAELAFRGVTWSCEKSQWVVSRERVLHTSRSLGKSEYSSWLMMSAKISSGNKMMLQAACKLSDWESLERSLWSRKESKHDPNMTGNDRNERV